MKLVSSKSVTVSKMAILTRLIKSTKFLKINSFVFKSISKLNNFILIHIKTYTSLRKYFLLNLNSIFKNLANIPFKTNILLFKIN